MTDWQQALGDVDRLLEHVSVLIDGGDAALPEICAPSGPPPPEIADEIRRRLENVGEALAAIAQRKLEITQELGQMDKLRAAGTQYLRY